MIRRHQEPETDVLDIDEAAALLKVSDRTLWGLARSGEVPSRRVGKQFRFSRSQLLEWLRNDNNANKKDD
jgi:excisionase family DNA binding protein